MNKYKTFAAKITALIIISATTLLTFYFTKNNIIFSAIGGITICVIIYFTKSMWLPERQPSKKTTNISLTIITLLYGTFGFWDNFIEQVLINVAQKFFNIKIAKSESAPAPILLLIFTIIIIWIINYYNRDKSGMGIHPTPISEDIPDRNYNEKLKGILNVLKYQITSIDTETNWSNIYFVPLEAEVELTYLSKRRKRIDDLILTIKNSTDRLFLVLGEPGSGKSVALRKLCSDLLDEAESTGKIPIYINLKEWNSDTKWHGEDYPKAIDLRNFVLEKLQSKDIATKSFFDQYFDILYETGRLYFIFDSFDEIPAVLDEKENSELINRLSETFYYFLKGGRSEKSQGILASRIFRKPTYAFQVKTVLEIRPLSEKKILNLFNRRVNDSDIIISDILVNRQDLFIALKNPFLSTLLISYLDKNKSLPNN